MSDSINFVEFLRTQQDSLDAGVSELTTKESRSYQREMERLSLRKEEAGIKTLEQDNDQRKEFSSQIFQFTCLWLSAVLFLLICTGLKKLQFSDTILVTLLTTTTANVFGFFAAVVHYLYQKNKV